jgi:phytoene/squalene synthetase
MTSFCWSAMSRFLGFQPLEAFDELAQLVRGDAVAVGAVVGGLQVVHCGNSQRRWRRFEAPA